MVGNEASSPSGMTIMKPRGVAGRSFVVSLSRGGSDRSENVLRSLMHRLVRAHTHTHTRSQTVQQIHILSLK